MLSRICRLAEAAVSEGEARVWKELLHFCCYSMYGKCDFQQWECLRVRVPCCPLFNPPNYLHTSLKVTYVCGIWWMSRKATNIAASLKSPLQTPGDSVLSISVSALVNLPLTTAMYVVFSRSISSHPFRDACNWACEGFFQAWWLTCGWKSLTSEGLV